MIWKLDTTSVFSATRSHPTHQLVKYDVLEILLIRRDVFRVARVPKVEVAIELGQDVECLELEPQRRDVGHDLLQQGLGD